MIRAAIIAAALLVLGCGSSASLTAEEQANIDPLFTRPPILLAGKDLVYQGNEIAADCWLDRLPNRDDA